MPEIDTLIENLREKHRFTYSQILGLTEKRPDLSIPLKIFTDRKLGPLEAIIKYLKENQKMRFSEIAKLLNRNQRTIWASYHNAKKKAK